MFYSLIFLHLNSLFDSQVASQIHIDLAKKNLCYVSMVCCSSSHPFSLVLGLFEIADLVITILERIDQRFGCFFQFPFLGEIHLISCFSDKLMWHFLIFQCHFRCGEFRIPKKLLLKSRLLAKELGLIEKITEIENTLKKGLFVFFYSI